MKINDLIEKCMETPGISMKKGLFCTELILHQADGRGSMMFFPLFPGVTLAYIFVNSPNWPAPDLGKNSSNNKKGPLIINYCMSGRCELVLNTNNYVYLTENQLSVTENYAQNQYLYPGRIYEGMEFFIDSNTLAQEGFYLNRDFHLDLAKIPGRYCPDEKTYISDGTAEIRSLFQKLWEFYDEGITGAFLHMRLLALEILGNLLEICEIPPARTCTFYTESQVAIAKQTEKIITEDLRQHYPVWQLAESFSVSETSLKNYFRGVFGENISVYLKKMRMEQAAKLLLTTKLSVSAIAEQVGYQNQSKFAAAFKKHFGDSPLEYRRKIYSSTIWPK